MSASNWVVIEYRFKSPFIRGHIVLDEHGATCDTTSGYGRWKSTTPFSAIDPHPISMWVTPPQLPLVLVAVGFLVVATGSAAVADLRANALVPGFLFALYLLVSMSLAAFFVHVIHRWKTEWIIYPTTIQGHRIAYIKPRKGSKALDEFTKALVMRVTRSRV